MITGARRRGGKAADRAAQPPKGNSAEDALTVESPGPMPS
jgi:hypothetical protein